MGPYWSYGTLSVNEGSKVEAHTNGFDLGI